MAGAYCKYCNNRCFVYRVLPDLSWSGHMATCPKGMEHDRNESGYDHATAVNTIVEHWEFIVRLFTGAASKPGNVLPLGAARRIFWQTNSPEEVAQFALTTMPGDGANRSLLRVHLIAVRQHLGVSGPARSYTYHATEL